jgi:hypothetical protein
MQVVKLDITLRILNYMQLYINDKHYPGLLAFSQEFGMAMLE